MVSSAKKTNKTFCFTKKITQFIVNYTAYILHSIHKCKWTKQTCTLEEFTASVGHCLSIGRIRVKELVNPRRACARVTVVVLGVCVSVYPSVPALAASASVETNKQWYSRVSLRLFLD